MQAVNLYILSRKIESKVMPLYDMALSARTRMGKPREEEIAQIRNLAEYLESKDADSCCYENWFYSFVIPQIGKEFDLLKIGKDRRILNIELKSQEVAPAKIRKQLEQNRHYLAHVAKEVISFTYVRQDDGKYVVYRYVPVQERRADAAEPVNLSTPAASVAAGIEECGASSAWGDTGIEGTSKGVLRKSTMEELLECMSSIREAERDGIESLFKPGDYLISPFVTPDLFLQNKYYLNPQQEDISRAILREIHKPGLLWGISGEAGTGKTLLLYDLAKRLSARMRICMIHCGNLNQGHKYLNDHLNHVRCIPEQSVTREILAQYDYVCVDETQRIHEACLNLILDAVKNRQVQGAIFSYDIKQALTRREVERDIISYLAKAPGFTERKLSTRIRTNPNIISFIRSMISLTDVPKTKRDYRDIDVVFANTPEEAKKIIAIYEQQGYAFISYTNSDRVIGQEYDKVILIVDRNFRYNKQGELVTKKHKDQDFFFHRIFYQNVTRAREKLCILVLGNPEVFEVLLRVKQDRGR